MDGTHRSNDNQTMKTVVSSPDAPTAVGPYSQAIRAGTLLFIAGQIPLDPSGQMVEGAVDIQARRVLDNIGAILKSAGLSFSDVVRTTVYLADMNDFAKVNEIYATYFSAPAPARATVQVARLPKDSLVEIQVIARLA